MGKRKRWERLRHILDAKGVSYDMVQSEHADSVGRLVKMLIGNGYKTIIIMGGDSALNDAVNCLMREEKRVRDEIVLGVVPNGVMNDFARFFDFDEDNDAQTVNWLMKRRVRLRINTDVIDRRVMTVCIGNGPGYGQTPSAVPYNGQLDVSVVYTPQMVQLIEGLWLLITGRFLNHHSVHPFRTSEVMVDEAKHAMVGIDGRLMKTPVGPFRVEVEQEVINFLIPD
jgi:diacylglycerol kinase family enzyme